MKAYSNKATDPEKKKNVSGYQQVTVKRNKKTGELERESDVSVDDIYADDKSRKEKTMKGFNAAPPRVGGVEVKKQGMATGGSKKQVKASVKRAKSGGGSKQAKIAALRAYGKK